MHLFAREVGILGTVPLVSATIPLAVGAGLASKVRSDGRVSVAFFGDGAMEEGPFHESANFAALYKLPILFVCENNYYASHMQLLERRSLDNLAEVGEAHGMSAVSLDGNDVGAIYRAAAEGVARGRDGAGPTFLECRTYRWRGHVGPAWDMDVGVLRKDELKDWLPKDPIPRARALLLERRLPPGEIERVEAAIRSAVEDAVAFAIESSAPPASGLLDHVYYSAGNS
jgi:pyruvate dehydrogenase E1 component alpha subunit